MFFFNPEKVSEFLDSIARGFERRPIDFVLFGALLLLLIGFLLAGTLLQRAKARRLAARLAREKLERLIRKLNLDPAEQALIDRLAGGDRGAQSAILESAAAFNRAVARLQEREPLEQATVDSLAELRLRLGFQADNPERAPAASSELPAGLPVLVAWRAADGTRRLGARVQAQEPEALVLGAEPGAELPPEGRKVMVLFQNRAGVFSFASEVRASGQGILRMAHSEALRRVQRRKYYRRRLRLPARVGVLGQTESSQTDTLLLDLSGEGASLKNPEQRFSVGEELALRFRLEGEAFALTGEVLRVSHGGQVLHVRFTSLREGVRDRLIGILLQKSGTSPG